MKNIFLSHSCDDHVITDAIRDGLKQLEWNVIVDPFKPGDKTCMKIQNSLKESTHFILLLTANSLSSYWVRIEALFAQLCYNQNAICYFPVSVDGTPNLEPARELIHINWKSSNDTDELINLLAQRIHETAPATQLKTDVEQSEILKEQGREFERIHARTDDLLSLHKAVETYEKAIKLNFCSHNAWANLAWSLWKLGEENRAWKCIRIAEDISPDSNHVKDVKQRIELGKRTIL